MVSPATGYATAMRDLVDALLGEPHRGRSRRDDVVHQKSIDKVAHVNLGGGGLTEYPVAAGAAPMGFVLGPDGNLWFAQSNSKIGRIATDGSGYTQFAIGPNGTDDLVVGPDGNLWFTETEINKIGRLTPTGTLTEFPDTGGNRPWQIVSNPADGALWFGDQFGVLGKITTAGVVSHLALSGSFPRSMVARSDGTIWWIDNSNTSSDGVLHRRTAAGVVMTYNVLDGDAAAQRLTLEDDGTVWLTYASNPGALVRIDPSTGAQTFVRLRDGQPVIAPHTEPGSEIWYGDVNPNRVGKLLVNQKLVSVTVTSSANPAPYGNLDVTATVASADGIGTPTGQVTFSTGNTQIGTVNLVNGVAALHNPPYGPGTGTIVADYSGDPTFASNLSAPFPQTVQKYATSTSMEVIPSNGYSRVGDSVTLDVHVTVPFGAGAPTGNVRFFVNGAPFGSDQPVNGGFATLRTAALPQGLDDVSATYLGDFNGLPSTSSAVQQFVDFNAQLDRYVNQVYIDLLGRLPDGAGRTYWTGLLSSGTPRACDIVGSGDQHEYRSDVITSMYELFLERDTDIGGLAYWVSQIAHGMTFEQFQCLLMGSDEYFQMASKGHGDDDTFVEAMYHDVLGRNVDPAGEAYFVSLLQQRDVPPQVVSAIVYSNENLATTVDGYYQFLLGAPVRSGRQRILGRPAAARRARRDDHRVDHRVRRVLLARRLSGPGRGRVRSARPARGGRRRAGRGGPRSPSRRTASPGR